MKQLSGRITLIASFLLTLAACSQGPSPSAPAAAAEDDSPEGQAFEYRAGLMHAVAWKVGKLNSMEMGEIPANDMMALKYSRDVASLAGMLTEGFIPNSAVKGSAALPEIWTNFPDFEQKAKDLGTAATALADGVQANGFESSKGLVPAVRQTCGGCHRPYRRKAE
jgi:cytochrome c556